MGFIFFLIVIIFISTIFKRPIIFALSAIILAVVVFPFMFPVVIGVGIIIIVLIVFMNMIEKKDK